MITKNSNIMKISGRVLITGGTGSWGHELCKQLLSFPKVNEIIIFSRNEHKTTGRALSYRRSVG